MAVEMCLRRLTQAPGSTCTLDRELYVHAQLQLYALGRMQFKQRNL